MITKIEDCIKEADKLRKEGKKIVTTNGCFDILHVGHAKYLAEARKMGDVLFVGINSDKSSYFKEKPGRPIVPERERLEMLNHLNSVDFVFSFDTETPNDWIEKIKPDLHVKCTDETYGIEQCVEKESVEKSGKVVLIPKVEGKSTTAIVEQVLKTYGGVKNGQ